jgi:hypothetical protein
MKKSQILGITIIAVIVLSCSVKPKDDTIDNSIQFFEKITKDNGIWVHQPEDTTFGFDTFLMKFQMKAGGYFEWVDNRPDQSRGYGTLLEGEGVQGSGNRLYHF